MENLRRDIYTQQALACPPTQLQSNYLQPSSRGRPYAVLNIVNRPLLRGFDVYRQTNSIAPDSVTRLESPEAVRFQSLRSLSHGNEDRLRAVSRDS